MRTADSELIAALARQQADLAHLIARLEAACATLLPQPATQWQGMARRSFDSAVLSVAALLQAARAQLHDAHWETTKALAHERGHG